MDWISSHPGSDHATPGLSQQRLFLLSAGFMAFAYLGAVGLVPFADRAGADIDVRAAGSALNQIANLAIAVLFATAYLTRRYRRVSGAWSPVVLVALAWLVISTAWSPVPMISLRRSLYAILVVFVVFEAARQLGPTRSVMLLYATFALCVAISVIAVPFIPNARHKPGDAPELVGLVRGIFLHKNVAGEIAAITFIMSAFLFARRRSPTIAIVALLSALLLYLSWSKTALILVLPATFSGVLYLYASRSARGRRLFAYAVITACIFALVFPLVLNEEIARILGDPEALTGRAKLWSDVLRMIQLRPSLGYGFGGVYDTGQTDAIASSQTWWMFKAGHSHNGYLDLLLHVGVIGFVLVGFAFLWRPLAALLRRPPLPASTSAMYLALLTFVLAQNFVESSYFHRARGPWLVLLLILANLTFTRGIRRRHPIEPHFRMSAPLPRTGPKPQQQAILLPHDAHPPSAPCRRATPLPR
jgi:exopolysaccharide production protein ExoQ